MNELVKMSVPSAPPRTSNFECGRSRKKDERKIVIRSPIGSRGLHYTTIWGQRRETTLLSSIVYSVSALLYQGTKPQHRGVAVPQWLADGGRTLPDGLGGTHMTNDPEFIDGPVRP